MATAKTTVRKFFPKVKQVLDGKKHLQVEVTKQDSQATRKDHSHCAFAVACQRQEKADGVIVAVSTVYVVKGETAYRYKTADSISREIVSFDRTGDFQPGVYAIRPPSPTERLDRIPKAKGHGPVGRRPTDKFVHLTTGIRTSLRGKRS